MASYTVGRPLGSADLAVWAASSIGTCPCGRIYEEELACFLPYILPTYILATIRNRMEVAFNLFFGFFTDRIL